MVSAHEIQVGLRQQLTHKSLPPDPFGITGGDVSTPFMAASLLSLSNFFSTPKPPDGLEIAKVPTFGGEITSYLGSFFGLFTGSSARTTTLEPPPAPASSAPVDFDFDNDGKTDIGRWHASTTEMKVKNSNGGSYSTFTVGTTSSVAAPGDFNGDDKTDAAVFLNGTWKYKTSTGGSEQTVNWGMTGDIPVAGDYDGDDITDFAVFRPSTNHWWVLKSSNSSYTGTAFGASGDILAQGDYDGDGKTDMAFYRPSTGDWHITGSTSGYYSIHWGIAADVAVPADYDGDGKTDPAVFRPTTGDWYAYKSSTNDGTYLSQAWGNYGDQPVPGYYDGDSKADFAVWRPTTGVWYIINSNDSSHSYHALGVAGDTAVPSAYLKQVGAPVTGHDLNKERLSPKNATGGTDLYSRNFSWSTSLAGLPGRSGLDAGFGMSYNSLVWIKQGDAMIFDPDNSNISPGFRFGFPVIEPVYYAKGAKDTWAYMMVTPSGGRVEFRQTSASNVFEAADSSYTQLVTTGASSPNDPVDNITIKVTGTDGTQMSYEWKAGAFRCTQIKDRNGNYITIAHNEQGGLSTVTDTLGRVITVNYDSQGYPTSITQIWKNNNGDGSNITHNWASFTYTTLTIDTNFSGINTIFGPPDGTAIKVLQKLTYTDGSHTDFSYNSYGQIWKISNIAADSPSHILNYVKTNLETPASSESDCPRLTQTSSAVENFNSGNPVVVYNTLDTGQTYSLPDIEEGTATRIQVWMDGHPDDLRSISWVGEEGWKEGLPIATEDCLTTDDEECTTRKRWSWTNWTQDNEELTYPLNPRVTETRVGDTSNVKMTTIDYLLEPLTNVSVYGLPETVKVYDTDLSTVIKQSYTEYNFDSDYTSRRIIGLPSLTQIYGLESASLNLVSKMTYAYDEGSFSDSGLNQNISPTQHDNTNYSSSFVEGRGNLTSTTRWDVTDPNTSGYAVTSSQKYNTAGSVVSQTDPRGRVTKLFYADNFNTSVSGTYAYPTTLTDSGGFSSTAKYRFDTGANVWARSPTPYGVNNSVGKTTSRTYNDTTGRITKEKIENNDLDAYIRYDYGDDGITLDTYTTIVDANNDNTINSNDEVKTTTLLDGAGRVRKTRTDNPGSTGTFTGKLVEYDLLGRVKRATVPTEINSSWNPAGDDYRGMDGSAYVWLWNSMEYDWKGRVTKEKNTDNTDRIYSYEGCGCAGNQITTIKGEVTEAIDKDGNLQTTKRRTQKVYSDILGRTVKTELWDLDGAGAAPYSTTVNVYNGRDQVKSVVQYAGAESGSNTHQDTTRTFDGHGRLLTQHNPIENTGVYTSYTYNADDTVATMTDPRGAVTTYKYGHIDDSSSSEYRALLSKVSYSVPSGSGIPVPATVSFLYDSAGNRKQMDDGSGTLTYSYDELSRLKAETKTFTDTLADMPSGGYKLTYNYHLTGGIKSIQDPFDAIVTYDVDKAGRTTDIGGSGFYDDIAKQEITSYVSDISYRAFGGVKSMTKSTTEATHISLDYDSRLRPAGYQARVDSTDIQDKTYTYNNDSSVKMAVDDVDDKFNRYFDYDFASRLKRDEFGTANPGSNKPYKETLGYDPFNNITSRSTKTWDFAAANFTAAYTNHRKTSGGFNSGTDTFDAAGNIVISSVVSESDSRVWQYDAAGRVSEWRETAPYVGALRDIGGIMTFDGDGRTAKRLNRARHRAGGNTAWSEEPEYSIYSSVTGQTITTLTSSGQKHHTYVYMGSSVIADQNYGTSNNSALSFTNSDPVIGSETNTDSTGDLLPGPQGRVEMEALGAVVPHEEGEELPAPNYRRGGNTANPETGCQWNGAPVKCSLFGMILNSNHVVEIRQLGSGTDSWMAQSHYKILFHSKSDRKAPNTPDIVDTEGGFIRINTAQDGGWFEISNIPHVARAGGGDITEKIVSVINSSKSYLSAHPKCEDFLNRVIGKLSIGGSYTLDSSGNGGRVQARSYNIRELLDLTGRATITETGTNGVSRTVGSMNYVNDLAAEPGYLYVNRGFSDRKLKEQILSVLHDSFHQMTGATDQAIAVAAQLADGTDPEDVDFFDHDDEGRDDASLRFNEIVSRYCGDLTNMNTTTYRFEE